MTKTYSITPYYQARVAVEKGAEFIQEYYSKNNQSIDFYPALVLALKEIDLELYKYMDEEMDFKNIHRRDSLIEDFFKRMKSYYIHKCGLYLVSIKNSRDIKNGGEVIIVAYIDAIEGLVSEFKRRTYLLRDVDVLSNKLEGIQILNILNNKTSNDSKGV